RRDAVIGAEPGEGVRPLPGLASPIGGRGLAVGSAAAAPRGFAAERDQCFSFPRDPPIRWRGQNLDLMSAESSIRQTGSTAAARRPAGAIQAELEQLASDRRLPPIGRKLAIDAALLALAAAATILS